MSQVQVMAKFRILHITNNLDEYPHCQKDNDEFPHVINLVQDEYDMFVLDEDEGHVYPASEFFYMIETDNISSFNTNTQAIEDELFIATTFIKSIKKQCGHAKDAMAEHLACWAAVTQSPIVITNRIELTDKERTFIELKRKA